MRVPHSIVYKHLEIPAGEMFIMYYLFKKGPLAVTMRVYPSFVHLKRGIYRNKRGEQPQGLHSLLLIGYGVEESGEKYWLVKVKINFLNLRINFNSFMSF